MCPLAHIWEMHKNALAIPNLDRLPTCEYRLIKVSIVPFVRVLLLLCFTLLANRVFSGEAEWKEKLDVAMTAGSAGWCAVTLRNVQRVNR